MTELIQKAIWDKRSFRLLDDGVHVRMKTPTEDVELSVKYDELGLDTVVVRKKEASAFFTGLIFLSCIIGSIVLQNVELDNTTNKVLFVVFFLFVLTVLYLARSDSRKQLLGINGGEKTLALIRNSPNEQAVDIFVKELHDRIKRTIIKKRLRPDDTEGNSEYKKLILESLKEDGIVNDEEYDALLQQISTKKAPIGFLPSGDN